MPFVLTAVLALQQAVSGTVNLCQVCQVEGEGYSVSLLADDLVRAVHSMLVQTSTVLPLDLVLESKRFNAL